MFIHYKKNTGYLTAIFLLFMVSNIIAQQYWIQQPCPTTKKLNKLAYTDSLNLWAAGDSGIIIHTSNGGSKWEVQQSNIISSIESISFPNNRIGWAISNDFYFSGTIILKTTNGGVNWNFSRYLDTTLIIQAVYFIDSLTGFMGGYGGIILKTTNGGLNWSECFVESNPCNFYPVINFNFRNALTGFAAGGIFDVGGVVWRTTNGGASWKDSCIASEPLFDILQINPQKVVTVGGDYEYGASYYETLDGGESWVYTNLQILGIARAISKRTSSEYWVASNSFLLSTDSAKTWKAIEPPDSIMVTNVMFINERLGWSVGGKGINYGGAIFKYNTAVIGVEPNENNLPLNAVLYQNYPNPFNPATKIKYSITKKANIVITVHDILGKEVFSFNEGLKEAGTYSVNFDASMYASGVYFYKLNIKSLDKEFTINKKMVLIK